MTDDDTPAPYALPDNAKHPATIAARLMRLPEHAPLAEHEVSFGWLMRTTPKEKGGKVELGSVHDTKTMFQGAFKDMGLMLLERMLGYLPQYLVVINAEWWDQASDIDSEALIFHELMHVKQAVDQYGALRFDRDGYPVWRLVGHDIEEFNAVVARYGAWQGDIASFLGAAGG